MSYKSSAKNLLYTIGRGSNKGAVGETKRRGSSEYMSIEDKNGEVRYCVTAILDLLGFATHLEIASNDLRTNIGQEAINRLQVLEDALQLMAEERAACPQEYAETYYHIRINDAIIFTIDLPDILRPSPGESAKTGMTVNEIGKFFGSDKFESAEDAFAAYQVRLSDDVGQLIRFVGMVARFHSFINRKDSSAYFPGARTIIATGYRRPFGMERTEDFLSANFSFSNAYLAEKYLSGPRFFVDDNVSKMLCMNRFARNLLRFACFTTLSARFDPFYENEDPFDLVGGETVLTKPVDVPLFRKSFQFRDLAPHPLSYLQIIPRLSAFLDGHKQPAQGGNVLGSLARKALKAIINGPQVTEHGYSPTSLGVGRMDLEDDIRVMPEVIESGESPTLKHKIDNEHISWDRSR